MKRWTETAGDWGELGGGMNGFALRMGEEGNGGLEEATEKVGMAVDGGYTSTNAMVSFSLRRSGVADDDSAAPSLGTHFHRTSCRVHPVQRHHQVPPQVPPHEAPPIRDDARAPRVQARRP